MVGFIIAFGFFSLCALCIATLIRGWKAYSVIVVLVPTFAILIPFAPANTAVFVWYFTVIAPLTVMIYYGERGCSAFENFMTGLGGHGESLIERFKKWNQ
jgi:hypothetical protein